MDGSNDYYESENFKRSNNHDDDLENEDKALENSKNFDYIRDLIKERNQLDSDSHACRLLDLEIQSAKSSGKPFRDQRYVDVYREKQIRVVVKVIVPVKEHPKFNFVGKLLGPRGNSMRRLQEETLCKMAILGRGSMKDRKREEELRVAADPKYAHLNDDLHVEISAIGPPSECYARVAFALAEVRKYLIPDSNDNIRQEQLREIMSGEAGPEAAAKIKQKTQLQYKSHAATADRAPRTVVPAKTKIFSILDRASYEEAYEAPPAHHHPYHQHELYSHVHRPREYRYEAPAAPEYQHAYRESYPGNSSTNFYPIKTRSSWKEGSSRESKHSRSEHSSSRYRPYAK
ncbi:unnamed protein product [Diamesa tonsa]